LAECDWADGDVVWSVSAGDLLTAAYNLPCFFTKWHKGRFFWGGKHYILFSPPSPKEAKKTKSHGFKPSDL